MGRFYCTCIIISIKKIFILFSEDKIKNLKQELFNANDLIEAARKKSKKEYHTKSTVKRHNL